MQAQGLTSFLLPMLTYNPDERATAAQMLQHPWLRGELPRPPSRGREAADDERRAGDRARSRAAGRSRTRSPGAKRSRYM